MPVPRKILIRVIGAPLLVAALCGIIYWGHTLQSHGKQNTPLQVLLLVVSVLCGVELYAMCAAKGIATARIAGLVAIAAYFAPALPSGADVSLGSLKITPLSWIYGNLLLYLLFKMVFRYGKLTPEGAALTFFGFEYITLLSYVTGLPGLPGSAHAYYLLFLLAAGKGSDMAAFVVGKSMGKHKMTPVVSPNKTWEGGIAGGIVGMGAGLAVLLATPLRQAYVGVPIVALLFFCLMVTIAAQVGDLIKSAFKRWAGVKDSGRILPEFGGMLDMVDSFIIAAPVAVLGTRLLNALFKGS
ncbi:MAG TPA: phosphatidate cytidylyltransferase [Planctomycetota bacterium]|jgi:phosphatidate cytidylyltransferase|nr:phosphatidate cytidylyltransferase [Planctomycetota bacterium]